MLLFKARIQQKQHMSLHLNCATSEWHIQSCNLQLGLGEVIWLYCSFFIQPSSRITPPCPLSLKYEPPPPRLRRSVYLNQLDTCALSEMTSAALWQCCFQPLISVGWRLFTAVSSFTSN